MLNAEIFVEGRALVVKLDGKTHRSEEFATREQALVAYNDLLATLKSLPGVEDGDD